jgi:hypothetical protein
MTKTAVVGIVMPKTNAPKETTVSMFHSNPENVTFHNIVPIASQLENLTHFYAVLTPHHVPPNAQIKICVQQVPTTISPTS